MDFLALVRKRRSIRSYRPDAVPHDVLDRCLEAARLAPSACNSQPWQFIVVDSPDQRQAVADAAFTGVYTVFSFAKQSPVLVVVTTDRAGYRSRLGGFLRNIRFSLVDIGIAVEHFVLAATEAGLGTCWVGWFSERGVRKALGLPRRTRVVALVCVGYPPDEPCEPTPRKSLEEIRSYV
jgi:nitroreductase